MDLATKVEQDLLHLHYEIVEMGFPTKEITINIRENDLLRYNTSFQEISMAIIVKIIISLGLSVVIYKK